MSNRAAEWFAEMEQRERVKNEERLQNARETAPKRPTVVAVDFDGTLCDNAWPSIGREHWGTIRWCLSARAAGAKLILWTNRTERLLREAVRWCKAHGLEFDAVNENLPGIIDAFGGDTRKVVADIYLDDKAVSAQTVEMMMRGITPQ